MVLWVHLGLAAGQELLQLIIGRNDRQWRLELMPRIGDEGTLLVIIADKWPDAYQKMVTNSPQRPAS